MDRRSKARTGRPVLHEVVHLDDLGHVYRRPPFGEYLRKLWGRRHFIRADARGRVISGSAGTVLGMLWLVLRPILDGAAYYTIFGIILNTQRGIPNFLGYLLIGVFLFRFTSRCLSAGASSLTSGRNLMKAFTFPRAALPVAVVTREAISFIPVLGVMMALILLLPPTEVITWRWALFPVILAMQFAFAFGLALVAARVTVHVPDLNQLISVLTRFWLYSSAVFFARERFESVPWLYEAMGYNPMFLVLDMSRDVLLYGVSPSVHSWVVLTAWTVVTSVGGMIFFWRGEERYGSL
ncbi:phosphate ABC transporter permease [Cellulomonas bogoriensis 69B4 = DSM 16987]|uniref:Transport permease protein n=1 Tax=Cellulomonas bogoriensis 69B4 = DSM 16987 TaxID=1386082 RepID=A0A0A0C0Y2_9CELL|nr:phosphate ABC transporter permease [Cellulomonas bogoriensis 69B4 = DSM 16987]